MSTRALLLSLALVCSVIVEGRSNQIPFAQHDHGEYYQFQWPIQRVAIIGAGVSGLVSYQEFLKAGFEVRVFERDDVPGGNWHYSEETPSDAPVPNADPIVGDFVPSLPPEGVTLPYRETYNSGEADAMARRRAHRAPKPAWESLTANAPSPIQQIPEFPWPDNTAWELPHRKLKNYLRSFASFNGANSNDGNPNFEYNTRVENVVRHPNGRGWLLTLKKFVRVSETSCQSTWWTEEFDAVLVATGRYNAPNIPPIPGLSDWYRTHPNSILHSRQYRRPEGFVNQTVLIVGAGSSGSEISRDINPFAKRVYQSIRPSNASDPSGVLRRITASRIPANTSIVGEIAHFGPSPSAFSDGLAGGEITLSNGTIVSGINRILFATGYQYSYPFLPQFHNVSAESKYLASEQIKPLVTDGTHLRALYLGNTIIPPLEVPGLCVGKGVGPKGETSVERPNVGITPPGS